MKMFPKRTWTGLQSMIECREEGRHWKVSVVTDDISLCSQLCSCCLLQEVLREGQSPAAVDQWQGRHCKGKCLLLVCPPGPHHAAGCFHGLMPSVEFRRSLFLAVSLLHSFTHSLLDVYFLSKEQVTVFG